MNDAPPPGSSPPVSSEPDPGPTSAAPSTTAGLAVTTDLAPPADAQAPSLLAAEEPSASPAPPTAQSPTAQSPTAQSPTAQSHDPRPSFLFFGVVSAASLVADIGSKVWAEIALSHRPSHPIILIEDHLNLTLAYNPGGAWGLLQDASEQLRKPFFVLVSMAAILFIVSLYSRLVPGQRALKWGLPLVLGGALGNLADRITRSKVIDFIDYRAEWIRSMNQHIAGISPGWSVTDHWPTFNVADIAICIGVGLMAVDMFTSRRGSLHAHEPAPMTQKSPDVLPGSDAGSAALVDATSAPVAPTSGASVLASGPVAETTPAPAGDNPER